MVVSLVFSTNPHLNSPEAAFLDVSSSLEAIVAEIIMTPEQMASCWVAYAPQFDSAFDIDALKPTITIVSPSTGDVTGTFDFRTPVLGGFDSQVDRSWLYTLTDPFNVNPPFNLAASPQVLVYDVSPVREGTPPHQVQSFDIFSSVGMIPNLHGLRVYPS
ncbi:hypothetical protein LTR70_009427 [Exophiala xenobiotica]|uniref:Uncharacterized protein n=1 Tax=Lithohypha guttulata TaxID=1690604 RepID=A0ABR0JXM9_9EURO|nr:hypothetical protein LTR24_009289 [Lithohypha guttulata]KAK5310502.1 hypothetical protein LTR70_009427 [Exophiala xenobiotica]